MWFTKVRKLPGTVDAAATRSWTETKKESVPCLQAKNTHLGLAHQHLLPPLSMLSPSADLMQDIRWAFQEPWKVIEPWDGEQPGSSSHCLNESYLFWSLCEQKHTSWVSVCGCVWVGVIVYIHIILDKTGRDSLNKNLTPSTVTHNQERSHKSKASFWRVKKACVPPTSGIQPLEPTMVSRAPRILALVPKTRSAVWNWVIS